MPRRTPKSATMPKARRIVQRTTPPTTSSKAAASPKCFPSKMPYLKLFLLPGEVRNIIYEYVFESITLVEFMPSHKTQYLLAQSIAQTPREKHIADHGNNARIIRYCGTLGRYRRVHGINTKWATSLNALTLVNQQLYGETIGFLYASCTFYFQSSTRLNNFLMFTPERNLQAVKSLSLAHVTFGEPYLMQHKCWKEYYDMRWLEACDKAQKSLRNLRTLDITIKLRERPLALTFDEDWARPLILFSDLGLFNASMTVLSDQFPVQYSLDKYRRQQAANANNALNMVWSSSPAGGQLGVVHDADEWHQAGGELHEAFGNALAARLRNWDKDVALAEYRDTVLRKWWWVSRDFGFCREEFIRAASLMELD